MFDLQKLNYIIDGSSTKECYDAIDKYFKCALENDTHDNTDPICKNQYDLYLKKCKK